MWKEIKVGASAVASFASKNSPTILTALTVAGVVTTGLLAADGGIKAYKLLEIEAYERRERWAKNTGEDESACPGFTKKEIVQYTWKCFIPAIGVGLVTISTAIGANHISLRRHAAIASLYTITERAAKEYEAKVVEQLGGEKNAEIKQEIAKDRVKKNPPKSDTIIHTGIGSTLFYDRMSGRYFYSDLEKIRKVVNDFNKAILCDGLMTLNEFYDEIGLSHIQMGDLMGWGTDFGFLEMDYIPILAENDQPCIALEYKVEPNQAY